MGGNSEKGWGEDWRNENTEIKKLNTNKEFLKKLYQKRARGAKQKISTANHFTPPTSCHAHTQMHKHPESQITKIEKLGPVP